MPTTPFWASCFFLVLFLLGLDCQFELLEVLVVAIKSRFVLFKKHGSLLWLLLCVSCFCGGIPCMMQFGYYILDVLDVYGGAFPLLFLALAQGVGVTYIYGVNNFIQITKTKLGISVTNYWKCLWMVSPVALALVFLATVFKGEDLTHLQKYKYPDSITSFGWFLSSIPIIIFVICGSVVIFRKFWRIDSSHSFVDRLKMALKWSFDAKKVMQRHPRDHHPQEQQRSGEDESGREQDYELKEQKLQGIAEDEGELSQTESEHDLRKAQCNRSTSINGLPVCLPTEDEAVLPRCSISSISAAVHAEDSDQSDEVGSGKCMDAGGGVKEGGGQEDEATASMNDRDSLDCVVLMDKIPELPKKTSSTNKPRDVSLKRVKDNRSTSSSERSSTSDGDSVTESSDERGHVNMGFDVVSFI